MKFSVIFLLLLVITGCERGMGVYEDKPDHTTPLGIKVYTDSVVVDAIDDIYKKVGVCMATPVEEMAKKLTVIIGSEEVAKYNELYDIVTGAWYIKGSQTILLSKKLEHFAHEAAHHIAYSTDYYNKNKIEPDSKYSPELMCGNKIDERVKNGK